MGSSSYVPSSGHKVDCSFLWAASYARTSAKSHKGWKTFTRGGENKYCNIYLLFIPRYSKQYDRPNSPPFLCTGRASLYTMCAVPSPLITIKQMKEKTVSSDRQPWPIGSTRENNSRSWNIKALSCSGSIVMRCRRRICRQKDRQR